jgi:transcriptional regulator with XRE-family HTH domain
MDVTATDFRRAHLIRLIERYGTLDHFSEVVGLAPSYISQLKTGKRGMGPRTARKIELALELDRGTLDVPPPGHDLDKELMRLLDEMPEKEAIRIIVDSVPSISEEGVRELTAALLARLSASPKE